MPNWRKLITSGSDAALNSLNVTSALTASGLNYPTTDGDNGDFLTTDGIGNLSFGRPNVYANVKNISGVTLQKGTPVHATGTAGNASEVIAASASVASTMPATYVLNETLADEAEGLAIIVGYINGVNTSTFGEGDVIYVGESGGFTNVKPQGSGNLVQNLGLVNKVDASNGSGYVYGSGRSNDVPNLPIGKIWVGSSTYSVTSSIVTLDEDNSQAQITGSLAITSVVNAGTDTDKFLVLDSSNNVDFRTGAEVRSDIGAGTGNGTVTGTGTDNQVMTSTGGTGIQGESNLTFDGTTLTVSGSGSTILDIQGSQGQLFSVTDDLTGTLFTVSDISGIPIFEVDASGESLFDGNVEVQGDISASGLTTTNTLTVTGLANQASEATALMISSSNVVGTRELGTNAFNSTAFTTCTGDITRVQGTGAVSGITLTGDTTSGDATVTLGGTFATTTSSITNFNTGVGTIVDGCGFTTCQGTVTGAAGSDTQVQYNSSGNFAGSSNLTFDGTNLTVGGRVTANEIVTNVVSQSISFATGSNRFGDEISDTHTFTGSLNVTGSLNLTSVINAGTDTDKFLVLDSSNNVDFRTGAEVRSDIGAGTGNGTVTGTGVDNQVTTWNGTTSLDGSSNFTYDGTTLDLTYTGTGDLLRLTSTDAGASSAPDLTFCRNSSSPADNDTLGTAQFWGKSTASNKLYAAIYGRIACATSGQTKGNISFKQECNNVFIDTANFSPHGLYVLPPSFNSMTTPGIGLTVTGGISGSTTLTIGSSQTNSGTLSSIAGGTLNSIFDNCSFIGGGYENTINGRSSFIGAGNLNTTNNSFAFVGGGRDNTADNDAGIVAGRDNTIFLTAKCSVIGGGEGNTITGSSSNVAEKSFIGAGNTNCINGGLESFIGSGCLNCITGDLSSIAGGTLNTGSAACSFIGGGRNNSIGGCRFGSVIVGGCNNNTTSGYYPGPSFITTFLGGGCNNCISGLGFSFLGGGKSNTISSGYAQVLVGGQNNTVSTNYGIVVGGRGNTNSSYLGFLGGGTSNTVSNAYSSIVGGQGNTNSGYVSFIGGGTKNCLTSNHSSIAGGTRNTGSGACSFIGGGARNYINTSAVSSSIVGGFDNTTNLSNTHIIGSGITTDKANYTFVNNLDVEGTVSASIFSGSFVGDGSSLSGLCQGTVDTTGTPANNQIAIFTDSNTLEGDSDLTWNGSVLGLGVGSCIQFIDQGGTFPTNTNNAFRWNLNNDSYCHYAYQPATDQIDAVFKITDNVGSTDRFVWWIDDYRGESYDAYPLYADGNKVVVNYKQKYNSGTAYSNNVDFYVASSGSTSETSNPVLFADASTCKVGIGTSSPSSSFHVDEGDITVFGYNNNRYLRFTESGFQGSYINYDGSNNILKIGVHNADDSNTANDTDGIEIVRSTGQVDLNYGGNKVFSTVSGGTRTFGILNILDNSNPLVYFRDGSNNLEGGIGMTDNTLLRFAVGSSGLATDTKMVVKSDGSVGIGTTSPVYSLDVNDDKQRFGKNSTLFFAKASSAFPSYSDINTESAFISHNSGSSRAITMGVSDDSNIAAYVHINELNNPGTSFVSIGTNTQERLRIKSDGNVGIGETDPDAKLTVFRTDSTYAINLSNTEARAGLSVKSSNSFDSKLTISSGASSRQYIQAVNNAATTGRDIAINPYGGNVGIGTDSPGKLLELKGGDNEAVLRLYNDQANTWDIQNSTLGKLDFIRGGSNTYMRIDQSGNVGIGTTNPAALLHVSSGTADVDSVVIIQSDTDNNDESSNPRLELRQDGDAVIGRLGYRNNTNSLELINQYAECLHLGTSDSIDVTILSNGNVGIGCTNPASALDVNGTTRTTALVETSARKYKKNIVSLQDQLDNIKKLKPVEFEWKETQKKDIGLIAEDVQKVYPQLVEEDDNGDLMGVKYSKITSLLIKAVQEQQQQIEELKEEIFILKQNK